MSESIEFSDFFKLLNEIKEGSLEKNTLLEARISEYKEANNSSSFLDELGKRFIHIGLLALYKYAESKNLELICSKTKENWEELADKNKIPLPQYLANEMISNIKDNKICKKISQKWNIREREINKHIRPMAQYITEGIIEVLE